MIQRYLSSAIPAWILAGWLLIPSPDACSQKHLMPGFIVTLQQDTVRGTLDYRDWEQNPEVIRFTDHHGEIHAFTPSGIRAFGTETGKIYRSKTVTITLEQANLTDMIERPLHQTIEDTTLFLRLLIEGEANLYLLKDQHEKVHFWIEKPVDSLYDLRREQQVVVETDRAGINYAGRGIAENNIFRYMLLGVLNDRPDLEPRIMRCRYTEQDLVKLVKAYNESFGPVILYSDLNRIEVKGSVVAGGGVQWFKVTGHTTKQYLSDPAEGTIVFEPGFTYAAGAGITLVMPFLHGAFQIYTDVLYKHLQSDYSNTVNTTTFPKTTTESYYSIKAGYLKLNTFFRYHFPTGTVRPFLQVGMSNSYALQADGTLTTIVTRNGVTDPPVEQDLVPDSRRYEAGLVAGGGVTWRWLGLEIRYEMANGFSSVSTLRMTDSSLLFLLSCTLP